MLVINIFYILAKKNSMTNEHEKMIERIYSEIVGDEYTPGLIPRVDRLEKKVGTHDVIVKIGAGIVTILTTTLLFFEQIKKIFE